jgi:hypothetical protein
MTFHPASALFLLPAMLVLIELGYRLRLRYKTVTHSSAIEGAVFGLFVLWRSNIPARGYFALPRPISG